MNNYNISFNNKLNDYIRYSPGRGSREKINDILTEKISDLDKFVAFVDPEYSTFKFKKTKNDGVSGDAKKILKKDKFRLENRINNRILKEARNRFDTVDSVLTFVDDSRDLTELMASDGNFRTKVFTKLGQMLYIADAEDTKLSGTESFFSKMSQLTTIGKWQTQTERIAETSSKLFIRFFGALSLDEIKGLFSKKEEWTGAEHIRLSLHLALNVGGSVNAMDLGIFETTGKETNRLVELKQVLSTCWDELWKKYIEGIGTEDPRKNEDNYVDQFVHIYHAIHLNRDPESEPFEKELIYKIFCYQSIFEKQSADGIYNFIKIFKEVNKRCCDRNTKVERERQMLRCVPLKKYFNRTIDTHNLELAALHFVRSVEAEDPEGIVTAKEILSGIEYRNTMIYRYYEGKGKQKKAQSMRSNFNLGFINTVKGFLTEDEWSIFTSNYQGQYSFYLKNEMTSGAIKSEPEPEIDVPDELKSYIEYLKEDLMQLRLLLLKGEKADDDKGKGSPRSDPVSLSASIVAGVNRIFDRHQIRTEEDKIDFIRNRLGLFIEEQEILVRLCFSESLLLAMSPVPSSSPLTLEERLLKLELPSVPSTPPDSTESTKQIIQ